LRKWTLTVEPWDESPQLDLNLFQARMDKILTDLGNIFRGPRKAALRDLLRMAALFYAKPMPNDLRTLTKAALSLLARLTHKYATSHAMALVALRMHIGGICTSGYAAWHRGDSKGDLEEWHSREIEKAIGELPAPQPLLLETIQQIANYGSGRGL
jgi:hypothetical protein